MVDSPELPDSDEDAPLLQVDESTPADMSREFADLSAQLGGIGALLYNADRERMNRLLHEHDDFTEDDDEEADRLRRSEFQRALTAMRSFRRDYYYWERVVAEYALTRMGYTQRDAAKSLGVGLSTINRWAQHPIKIEDYR